MRFAATRAAVGRIVSSSAKTSSTGIKKAYKRQLPSRTPLAQKARHCPAQGMQRLVHCAIMNSIAAVPPCCAPKVAKRLPHASMCSDLVLGSVLGPCRWGTHLDLRDKHGWDKKHSWPSACGFSQVRCSFPQFFSSRGLDDLV